MIFPEISTRQKARALAAVLQVLITAQAVWAQTPGGSEDGSGSNSGLPETRPWRPQQVWTRRASEPPVGPRVKELFAQGVELLRTNKPFEARSFLEQAVLLAPRSAGIHCNLGLAYQNSGNIPRAINEFKIALSLSPNMPEATLNLAGCYQSAGNNPEAIKWYIAYLRENPSSPQEKQVRDIIEELSSRSHKAVSDPSAADYFENIVSEGSYRWPEEKIPLKVFVEDGRDVKGYKDSFRADLIKSFNSWCEASDGRLCYRIVIDRRHADIDCGWTANPTEVAGDGRVSERGSAKLTARAGIIQNATLKILTRPILENGILSDDDMTKACLHEVGHVLGLQGHSTNNHDVMFYTVDTATVWPVLSRRDKRTIARLYEKYRRSPSNAVR